MSENPFYSSQSACMRVIIVLILAVTAGFEALVIYERVGLGGSFDGFAVAVVALLSILCLGCVVSLALYRTPAREMVGKVWLGLISAVTVFLVSDLVAGRLLLPPLSPPTVPDRYTHHKLAPNTHSVFQTAEFNYVQRVNHLGLRGYNVSVNKRPGTYRIITLGDSFTMGKGVRFDETFSQLLERSLNRDGQRQVEVINAGVDSYSPILSLFLLARELSSLRPDLVVLNFDMSDLVQEAVYRRLATYGPDGEVIGVDGWKHKIELPPTQRVKSWVTRHLYLTRFLLHHLEKWSSMGSPLSFDDAVTRASPAVLAHTLADDEVDRSQQWEGVFDSILRIKRHCDRLDADFLLTVYPWGHQVNGKEWEQGRSLFIPEDAPISDRSVQRLRDFADAHGIPLLDLFPAFRSADVVSPLYYSRDPHWTPAGHALMARELERFIRAVFLAER